MRVRIGWVGAVVALLLAFGGTARADDVTDAELKNLRDTAINAAQAIATKGESVRGASGPLVELLKNSGDLICASWIISFYQARNRLAQVAASTSDPDVDLALQKADDYLHKIEALCADKPAAQTPGGGAGGAVTGGGGGGTGGGGTDGGGGTGGTEGGGKPFVPRRGWTIDDEICARRCADAWGRYLAAVRERDKALERSAAASAAAAAAETAAKAADTAADAAEQAKKDAQKWLREHPVTHKPSDVEQKILNQENANASADVDAMRAAAKKQHDEADEAKKAADADKKLAADAQAEVDKALAEYEACTKRCSDEAKMGKSQAAVPSSGASFGARLGGMLPLGAFEKGSAVSDGFVAGVPVAVTGGYRIDESWYVGADVAFALLFPSSTNCPANVSCSGWDLRLTIEGQYAFAPIASTLPWVGAGVGYEILHEGNSVAGFSSSTTVTGLELLHVAGGADFRVAPRLRVGPMASVSLGQFLNGSSSSSSPGVSDRSRTIDDKRFHEWIVVGGRGVFDL